MGILSLFSSLLYKGSFNVEVRRSWSALCQAPHRRRCGPSLARARRGAARALLSQSASTCAAGHRGGAVRLAPGALRAAGLAANLGAAAHARGAQVTVADSEPAESALRRFRKSVLNSGVLPEVRQPRAPPCPGRCSALGRLAPLFF